MGRDEELFYLEIYLSKGISNLADDLFAFLHSWFIYFKILEYVVFQHWQEPLTTCQKVILEDDEMWRSEYSKNWR